MLARVAVVFALIICLCDSSSRAAEIKMGFGDKLQPFCIPDSNSGIEVDIVRQALAYRGHVLHPFFYPIKRVPRAFISEHLDGAMMDSGFDLTTHGGVYAEPAVLYDNVFISLKERQLKIKTPSDLKGLSVIAFPGALERFPEWLGSVHRAGNYTEVNDQSLQVKALFNRRYDLVLSDRHIFRYYAKEFRTKNPLHAQKISEHDFIKANPMDYRLIFRSKEISADYEAGLRNLKKTGWYKGIYDKYLNQ